MSFVIDWTVNSDGISISDASRMTGASQESIKQMYRRGDFGPAPDVALQVTKLPIYNLAALFVLLALKNESVPTAQAQEALRSLAGSVFVQLQLTEIAYGRCVQHKSTPSLDMQLWTKLKSPEGREMLESKLPGGAISTYRYACFCPDKIIYSDTLEDFEGGPTPMIIIDAWAIATKLKRFLRGTIFTTRIA